MPQMTNYHAHTVFCHGKDTVEDMVKAAVQQGMGAFGLSGHSMLPFGSTWHIAPREHEAYCAEVRRVADQYAGQIAVLLGFEADFIPSVCAPDFGNYAHLAPDFLIGSVHYVRGGQGYFEADGVPAQTRERIRRYFGGDVKKAVQAYFDAEREMLRTCAFTFIGHCDLIRIQNGTWAAEPLFDEADGWYREELRLTAQAIASAGVCVEINTGALSRGYLDVPYPAPPFLELLRERGVPVTFASDAHTSEHVSYGYEAAVQVARNAGYTEFMRLDGSSLVAQPL